MFRRCSGHGFYTCDLRGKITKSKVFFDKKQVCPLCYNVVAPADNNSIDIDNQKYHCDCLLSIHVKKNGNAEVLKYLKQHQQYLISKQDKTADEQYELSQLKKYLSK